MDLMRKAHEWLEEQRGKYLSVPVIYRRGDSFATLSATVGKTVFKVLDDYGRYQHIESRDYLINSAVLIIDGQRALPKTGDEIIEGTLTYEVMAPNHEPEWRYSDSNRRCLRIHTKFTGEIE